MSDFLEKIIDAIGCADCGARKGEPCVGFSTGRPSRKFVHGRRRYAYVGTQQLLQETQDYFREGLTLRGNANAIGLENPPLILHHIADPDYTDTELRVAQYYAQENKEKDMASSQQQLEARRARLERELERAEAELDRLANLPEEPPVDSVISFERVFEYNGQSYGYVAYRAHDDWWYLTQDPFRNHAGGHARKRWFELLDFIGDADIFVATKWAQLQ